MRNVIHSREGRSGKKTLKLVSLFIVLTLIAGCFAKSSRSHLRGDSNVCDMNSPRLAACDAQPQSPTIDLSGASYEGPVVVVNAPTPGGGNTGGGGGGGDSSTGGTGNGGLGPNPNQSDEPYAPSSNAGDSRLQESRQRTLAESKAIESFSASVPVAIQTISRQNSFDFQNALNLTAKINAHNQQLNLFIQGAVVNGATSISIGFRTAPSTPWGVKVRNASAAINFSRGALPQPSDPTWQARSNALDFADISVMAGDQEYYDGHIELGDQFIGAALELADFSLSFVPGVNMAKDLAYLATGKNLITGRELSGTDRAIIIAGLAAPAVITGTGKILARVATIAAHNMPAESLIARKIIGAIEAADHEAGAIVSHVPEGAPPGVAAGEAIDALNPAHVPPGQLAEKSTTGLVAENLAASARPHQVPVTAEQLEAGLHGVQDGDKVLEGLSHAASEHGLVPTQIRPGTNGDVALVGRSMGNPERNLVGVKDAAESLEQAGVRAETFEPSAQAEAELSERLRAFREKPGNENAYLPEEEIRDSLMYIENKAWATKLRDEGYTIIDLGNPNNITSPSEFYKMELQILFP